MHGLLNAQKSAQKVHDQPLRLQPLQITQPKSLAAFAMLLFSA